MTGELDLGASPCKWCAAGLTRLQMQERGPFTHVIAGPSSADWMPSCSVVPCDAITDCGQEGCEECDVCTYLNFLEWAGQVAPRGESTIERDRHIEAHLDQRYPGWRN